MLQEVLAQCLHFFYFRKTNMHQVLSDFEEMVLLAVGILYCDAYGLAITDELENRTGRTFTISAVHKALMRLEQRGLLRSQMGGATEERGGRKKRLFTITNTGKEALFEAKRTRDLLWEAVPKLVWDLKSC
jgi:DNA-binding PadR family transcriptional regulator